jgi:hypothetical protein
MTIKKGGHFMKQQTGLISVAVWSILIFLGLLSAGCAKENKLRIENSLPVTFELEAKKSMLGLSVEEIAPIYENGQPVAHSTIPPKVLWVIRWTGEGLADTDKRSAALPKIVYGVIPSGFEQLKPHAHEGSPPALEEGKIYEVSGGSTDFENNPKRVWFKIEAGKVLHIPRVGE